MVNTHFANVENQLLALFKIPAAAGHPLHKGTPREIFIREFLSRHLGEQVAIGSGEIIDANSRPGEKRNQIDLVIYNRGFPKLDFGGGISCFLAESVIATIEVKTRINKQSLKKAIQVSSRLKALRRDPPVHYMGYYTPNIRNYIVAYQGPKNIKDCL